MPSSTSSIRATPRSPRISARVPDVILLSSLLSPRDEEDLLKHLRLVEGTEHVQTHNIPMMAAAGREEQDAATGLFGRFRRKQKQQEVFSACDPSVYAEEIRSYVLRAEEAKIEVAARSPRSGAARRTAARSRDTPESSRRFYLEAP